MQGAKKRGVQTDRSREQRKSWGNRSVARSEPTAPKQRAPDPFGMHLMRADPWEGSGVTAIPRGASDDGRWRLLRSHVLWSQMIDKDPFGIAMMREADEACDSRQTTCAGATGTSIAVVAAQAMVAEGKASTERAKLTSIDEQSVEERRSERSSVTELRERHIASGRLTDLGSASALRLALATEQSANEEDAESEPESEAQEAQRNSATTPKQQPPSRQTDVASPRVEMLPTPPPRKRHVRARLALSSPQHAQRSWILEEERRSLTEDLLDEWDSEEDLDSTKRISSTMSVSLHDTSYSDILLDEPSWSAGADELTRDTARKSSGPKSPGPKSPGPKSPRAKSPGPKSPGPSPHTPSWWDSFDLSRGKWLRARQLRRRCRAAMPPSPHAPWRRSST